MLNLVDATNVQQAMRGETAAFSMKQRGEMSAAVSARMKMASSEASPVKRTVASDRKAQHNPYLHHYVSETRWAKWQDPTVKWDSKLEDGCEFLLEMGCRHPSDDTIKVLIVILQACSKKVTDPDSNYDELRTVRVKLTALRKLNPGTNTMQDFPSNVSEFMPVSTPIIKAILWIKFDDFN